MAKQASEAGRCGYNRRVMPILVVVPVRDSALKDKYHGAIVEDALRMRLINKVADGLDLSHAMQGGTSVRVVVLGLHESYGPSCEADTASWERYFEGNVEETNSSHMHHQFVKLAGEPHTECGTSCSCWTCLLVGRVLRAQSWLRPRCTLDSL